MVWRKAEKLSITFLYIHKYIFNNNVKFTNIKITILTSLYLLTYEEMQYWSIVKTKNHSIVFNWAYFLIYEVYSKSTFTNQDIILNLENFISIILHTHNYLYLIKFWKRF